MATSDKLIGNSAFLFLDWLAITVLSLIFWLIIGKTLPREIYGIVATALNIMLILSSVSLLGLHTTLTKLISEFKEKNQIGKIRNLVRFSMKTGLSVSLAVAAAVAVLSPFLSPILNLPVPVILIASLGIFLYALLTITNSVMYGFQQMKRVMKTDLLGNAIKVIVVFVLIVLGFSYFGPLAGLLISISAIILLRLDTLLLARKNEGSIRASPLNFRSIFTYSASALAASLAMIGFSNTPNIILNALAGPAITGLFAISLTITSPIFSIPGVLNSALFPITSGLSAEKGGKSRQKILISMVLRYTSFITLPLIAVLLVFSGTIILFFSSGEFLPAVELLPIVGAAGFFFGLGGILNTSIYAIRKPVVSRNIIILTMSIFLALSIPLSIWLSVMGMAIAYLTSVFIFWAASAFYLKKFINISLEWKSMLKIVIAVLIFSAILFGLDSVTSSNILKIAGVIFASAVYLFVLVPLKFYKKEDLRILEFFSNRSPVGRKFFLRLRDSLSKNI